MVHGQLRAIIILRQETMRTFVLTLVAFALSGVLLDAWYSQVRADDQPFLTLDATDIEPELANELEQNFTWTSGKTGQSFDAIEGETEFEYGLSDQIQLAAAAEYDWTRARDHRVPGLPAISGTAFDAIRAEMIYQAMNVYFDPLGVGLLVSPGVGRNSRNLETKLLLQKNFINDRLRAVVNLGAEIGTEREDGAWSDVSALTFDAGIAYNITWNFSAALEFNVEHDFSGLLLNSRAVPTTTSFYVGPTIQYVTAPWKVTLGAQAQLPWASDATHTPGSLDNGFLPDAERFRIMLRITRSAL
jgi:hypothetical protein